MLLAISGKTKNPTKAATIVRKILTKFDSIPAIGGIKRVNIAAKVAKISADTRRKTDIIRTK